MATGDASAESARLPGLAVPCKAAPVPCKAENLAWKDHRWRQREREAATKAAAEVAGLGMPFMPAAEGMDFATTATNLEVVAVGTNNLLAEPDSVQWTGILDLSFS